MSLRFARSLFRAAPRTRTVAHYPSLVCMRAMSSTIAKDLAAATLPVQNTAEPVAEGDSDTGARPKRGRPRTARTSDERATEKRKRGRPRTARASDDGDTPPSDATEKRKRGRPKTTRASDDGDSADTPPSDATEKRKRGRPRTARASDHEDSADTPSDATQKRKRGRPRSSPKPDQEDSADKTQTKRVRGRPKRTPKAEDGEEPRPRYSRVKKKAFVFGDGIDLPHHETWRDCFPNEQASYKRPVVRDPETARLLAETFAPEGSKDLIIIEANPGPGQLTRALLALPRERIKKIIVIEHVPTYLRFLHPLAQLDDRVVVVPDNAKQFDVYDDLIDGGQLDDVVMQETLHEGVHPNLRFIAHLPRDVVGDQLIAHFMRFIPDRQWLFKYGRVPMHIIVSERTFTRIAAAAGSRDRCKVSVICEASADMNLAVPRESLQPYSHHFFPHNISVPDGAANKQRSPQVAMTIIPRAEQMIKPGTLEYWDYVLRKMFVTGRKPLDEAINGLGPGAFNLIPKLAARLASLKVASKDLSNEEWQHVVDVFMKWPFRPQALSINAFNMKVGQRGE